VYETLPGWPDSDLDKVCRFDDLPANARAYVRRVEEIAGVPAMLVSVGPRRRSDVPGGGQTGSAGAFFSRTRRRLSR